MSTIAKGRARARPYHRDLQTPLLRISPSDYFRLEDAVRSVAVFGATGSGKTSGAGNALATAYLRAGMAACICISKPEDVELWRAYARAAGRESDLVFLGENAPNGFNFIDYELKAQGMAGLGSVTECLMQVLDAERVFMPNAGGSSSAFWDRTQRQLVNNSLPYLYSAWGTVRMDELSRFIETCPKKPADVESAAWQAKSFMFQTWLKAAQEPAHRIEDTLREKMTNYWVDQIAPMDEKTRSNVTVNFTSAIDRFMHGRLNEVFCRGTTITPEDAFRDGKIIVLSMPVLSWREDGIIGQHVFKYMFQRAVLRRMTLPEEYRHRPVFIWADEAQFMVGHKDAEYQSACRSMNACTVYLTQSMPSYKAALGRDSEALVQQLLGNFATKIFHSNGDFTTNEWAANSIGKELQVRRNFSEGSTETDGRGTSVNFNQTSSRTGGFRSIFAGNSRQSENTSSDTQGYSDGEGVSRNRSVASSRTRGGSEQMDYTVQPAVFANELRTGGLSNDRKVDCVWFQTGRRFNASGAGYLRVTFEQ